MSRLDNLSRLLGTHDMWNEETIRPHIKHTKNIGGRSLRQAYKSRDSYRLGGQETTVGF